MVHDFYFIANVYLRYNYRMWVYLNPKISHRLNEQVIQQEFEVSIRHRWVNKTFFCFLLIPKGESALLILFLRHFGGRELLLNVNSYYGERRHWQPDCHTRTRSQWRGLRFVPWSDQQVMEVWRLWFESFESWNAFGRVHHPLWLQADHDSLSCCRLNACACFNWRCGETVFGFN